MTNKKIASSFNLLGKLMELHGENPFKVRSYYSAYQALRRLDTPLSDMESEEWADIKGVGKAIQGKIAELLEKGQMDTLDRYMEMTPAGIIEILSIKGLGPKKVKTIWTDLEIESPGELLYACNENRLVELKGFGQKTQEDLIKKISFYLRSKDQCLYPVAESIAFELEELLKKADASLQYEFVGDFGKKKAIVTSVDLLTNKDVSEQLNDILGEQLTTDDGLRFQGVPISIQHANESDFYYKAIELTAEAQIGALVQKSPNKENIVSQEDFFVKNDLPYIPPEIRDNPDIDVNNLSDIAASLVGMDDIKGVVHTHTTYSDGLYSVKEMAEYSQQLGYEYIVITDHSKSAFYANGLQVERVEMQQREIEELNQLPDFIRVFKGIECDILYDGSMDYDEDVMGSFDLVIASIHSQLKMDKQKATSRLISAIENPHVRMLGHMTGRLLLSREAYPVDHGQVIEACAEHNVAIELNANPNRLDIDHNWIGLCQERGVMISINPDAHNKQGIHDIRYGVLAARKGLLRRGNCVNALGLADFEAWLCKSN